MKTRIKIIWSLLIAFLFMQCTSLPFGSGGKLNRSKTTKADAAPKIEMAKSDSFTLENGLQVFVVKNHNLPRVSYSLFVDYGSVMEGKHVGMLDMYGSMLLRGTESRSKADLDKAIDSMRATFFIHSRGIYASSLKQHSDSLLEIFSDLLYHPSFSDEDLEKVKQEALSKLKGLPSDTEAIAQNVRAKVNYGNNHPYGEVVTGATLNNIKSEDLKEFHQTYFRPNISYLAIVGDITITEAKEQVEKYFGKWEEKVVPQTKFDKPKAPESTQVAISNHQNALQTVLTITYPVYYPYDSNDYFSTQLMIEILGSSDFEARLIRNLKEQKAYVYEAYFSLHPDELASSFSLEASVRNDVVDSVVVELLNELKGIKDEPVGQQELDQAKENLIRSFERSLENPQTIARFLINTARYNLPQDFYSSYIQKVKAVTIDEIQKAAQKYIKSENVTIVAIGNRSLLIEKLASFGNIQIYDAFGELASQADQSILKGMTAEKVIQNYLEKIGGKKWNEVVAIEREQTMQIAGMKMNQKIYVQNQKKLVLEISQRQMKQIYDGKKAFVVIRGRSQELPKEQAEGLKQQTLINPNLQFAKSEGYTLELVGAAVVDNKSVFEIKVTHPKYGERLQYFDPTTKLLVKEVSAEGERFFNDYKKIGYTNLLVPYSIKGNSPQGTYNIIVNKIELNPEINADIFVVE